MGASILDLGKNRKIIDVIVKQNSLAFLLSGLLLAEQICLGGDSYYLAAIFSFLKICAALIVLIATRPRNPFWRATWMTFLLLLLATGWLVQPLLVPDLLPWHTRTMLAPDLILSGVCRIFATFAILFAGACIGYTQSGARAMIDGLIVTGLASLVVGMALYQFDPLHVWGFDKNIHRLRFSGTLLNANAAACLFGVTTVLGLGRLTALRSSSPTDEMGFARILAFGARVAGIIMSLAACALSESRTVLVITSVLVIGLLATQVAPRLRGAALAIGFAFLGVVGAAFANETYERFNTIRDDIAGRVQIWSHYLWLANEVRWTGYGPLAFDEANVLGMTDRAKAGTFSYIHSPHNLVLDMLFVGGIPYLLLMLLAAATITGQVLNSGLHRQRPRLFQPLVASIILIWLCSLVDIALDVPVVAAYSALLIGLLWGRAISLQAVSRASHAARYGPMRLLTFVAQESA